MCCYVSHVYVTMLMTPGNGPRWHTKMTTTCYNKLYIFVAGTVNSACNDTLGTLKIVSLHPNIVINESNRVYRSRQGPPDLYRYIRYIVISDIATSGVYCTFFSSPPPLGISGLLCLFCSTSYSLSLKFTSPDSPLRVVPYFDLC